jgi:hypothetical protein
LRLPFLQVDTEFLATGAADLGEFLGLSEAEAGWAMVRLWGWAVSKATGPDDLGVLAGPDMQRLAERAAGWKGTSGTFLGALCSPAIGLARLGDNCTVSLLGLERYAATFRKNSSDKARMSRRRSGDIAATSLDDRGYVARKTETETEKEASASQESASAVPVADDIPQAADADVQEAEDRPALVLESPSGKKPPRKPSGAEALYLAFQTARKQQCEAAGLPFVEDGWANARMNRIGSMPHGAHSSTARKAASVVPRGA